VFINNTIIGSRASYATIAATLPGRTKGRFKMPRKKILPIAGFFMACCAAAAAPPASPSSGRSGYYRYPSLHGETVVFTSEGDLWSVGIHGGAARRLRGPYPSRRRIRTRPFRTRLEWLCSAARFEKNAP
jgi:tricorn protease-like protein